MPDLQIGAWWRSGPATYLRCPDCDAVLRAEAIDATDTGAEVIARCPEHGRQIHALAGWPGEHGGHLVREVCPECRGKRTCGMGWCGHCNGVGVVFVPIENNNHS